MRHAHQRGALCAHNELRNCLYQWQFVSDTRRKSCLQKNFDEVAHERYARSTEAAHYLGAAEMKSHNAATAFPVILAHNHVREQGFPALRYSICARLRLYGKVR